MMIPLPRVTLATKITDNEVHLFRDAKPVVSFYYKKGCDRCEEIKTFFSGYICATHCEALNQKGGKPFKSCFSDTLFPIFKTPDPEFLHHTVVYRTVDPEKPKDYHELLLIDGAHEKSTNPRPLIRKLKSQLHLMPSENKWQPLKHQADFEEWYERESVHEKGACMVHWDMGSGKTEGIIYTLFKNRHRLPAHVKKIYYVVPPTLIEMWHRAIHTSRSFQSDANLMNPMEHIVVGFQQFAKLCSQQASKTRSVLNSKRPNYDHIFLSDAVVVVDEMQYFRKVSKNMSETIFALQFCHLIVNSSGTILINDMEDLLGALLLMKGIPGETKWKTEAEMKANLEKWRQDIVSHGKGPELIKKIFGGRSHWYNPQIHDKEHYEAHYPVVEKHVRSVPMSLPQMFDYLRKQKRNYQIGNVEFSSSLSNSYYTLSKTLCNTCPWRRSNKLMALEKQIEQINDFPQVIYSRFLEKGVKPAWTSIRKRWPRLALMTGETPMSRRDEMIRSYNRGELDLFLFSSVGGKGLDLRNTKAMHLLDEFENEQSENQAQSRVARYESHGRIPGIPIRPKVQIFKYIATFPSLEGEFPVEEIKAVETRFFEEQYGRSLPLEPTSTSQLVSAKLVSAAPPEQWSIGDILRKLHTENAHGPVTVEEHMIQNNLRKEKDMVPLTQAFAACAKQISIR